ncbi:MAG: hypothetical protein BWX73_01002 [Lentisphaerae bacterium ADurb.Bin082]|nr:MAG: hypothetical protein BWX73_01002 [Lentisphaerae bacterium ADurb.Bin082]HQL88139.1 sugar-binding protein [Lentisphaeria bacterium]
MFKRTLLLLAAGAASAILAAAPDFARVAQEDILFLAHFNADVTPEIGNADGMVVNQAQITAGAAGYPFADSVPRPAALDVCRGSKYVAFPAERNFLPSCGTLQFMVKPQWRAGGYNHCVLFKLVFDSSKRDSLEWAGANSFIVQKPAQQECLTFFQNGNSDAGRISKDIPLADETWYQIAVTWDANAGQSAFYLNGDPVGTAKFLKMTAAPIEFTLGAPKTWNGQCLIDEVRILRRALTSAEIRQDALALAAGREFPTPNVAVPEPPTYHPVPPEKVATGFAASMVDVNFTAPFTARELTLDGALDEPEWASAPVVPALLKRNGKPPQAITEVRMLHSPTGLYLGAIMHEPDMANLVALYDQRDLSIFNDDCLEILLDTGGGKETFYHFCVNALGSLYDSKNGDKRWNGNGIKISTSRHQDSWIIEMFIPYTDLKLPQPQIGEYCGLRVCRERHHVPKELSAAPTVKSGSYSQRAYLGKLHFTPGAEAKKVTLELHDKSFQMGCNHVRLSVTGELPAALAIRTMLFDDSNLRLATNDTVLPAPVEGKIAFTLPVTIADDRTARVVIGLTDGNGNVLTSALLERGFSSTAPGLAAMRDHINELQNTLGQLRNSKHHVHLGAIQALTQITEEISAYEQALQTALSQKQIVPAATTEAIAANINGFRVFQNSYRYLVWETSPWEIGQPDAMPPMNYRHGDLSLRFRQASNEREPVCFIISGLLCGPRLDLRVVPQSSLVKGKPFLSCDNFEIYFEPFVDHNGEKITAPLVRAPGNIVTVTPGSSVRVWVMFNSRDVAPGDYATELTLKPLHDYTIPNRSIPVLATVWNFTLPETKDWPLDCFFWTGQMTPLDETGLLRLLHAYHVKWTMTESHHYKNGFVNDRRWIGPKPKEGPSYDRERVLHANQEFFEEARRLDMKVVFAWGTADDVEWHQTMAKRLLDMGFTYDDFIFHGTLRDEFSLQDIPKAAELRQRIAAVNPGWRFMATYLSTPPPSGASLDDLTAAGLPEYFKVWSVISGRLFNPKTGSEAIEYFKSRGCTLWAYRCNTNMQTLPVLTYYRLFPWLGYQKKLDGVAFWSSFSSKGDDGFDHRDGYDDGITWRGLNKIPIPTKRLEAVREGLEDVAYIHLLKQAIATARSKNPGQDLNAAEKLVGERFEQVLTRESQPEVDAWRREVGETIDRLSRE